MRLSAQVISTSEQRTNPLGERELILRGLAIPNIEHMAVTQDAFDAIDFCDNRLTRLDNFPRLVRLTSLNLTGNLIASVDAKNLKTNVPNLTTLLLSHNVITSLYEISQLGDACPKLELLSLNGNSVTRRQHYRLYTINKIPSLKVLDYVKISKTERDRADRLASSAAGAALESDVKAEGRDVSRKRNGSGSNRYEDDSNAKTFVPGEGRSAEESFVTNFTAEQKKRIRELVANASSPEEIEEIERSVQRGILPPGARDEDQDDSKPPAATTEDADMDDTK